MNVRKVRYYNQGIVKVPLKDIKMSKLQQLGIQENIFKGRKFLSSNLNEGLIMQKTKSKHCKNEQKEVQ